MLNHYTMARTDFKSWNSYRPDHLFLVLYIVPEDLSEVRQIVMLFSSKSTFKLLFVFTNSFCYSYAINLLFFRVC